MVQMRTQTKASPWRRRLYSQRWMVAMVIPAMLTLLVFHYVPLYGVVVAFKNYKTALGIWGSQWVGLRYIGQFFANPFAWRVIRNTLLLSLYGFLFSFPAPIILALLLNEVRHPRYKRLVQTISYLPHFISTVIIVSMLKNLLSLNGPVNSFITSLGGSQQLFMNQPRFFRSIFILSNIWQGIGWGTIIYLAALSGVSAELYEAALIDGANRWQQMISITLPTILPTVVVLMILNVQGILNADTQKILLMYNERIYETADVIDTYVYREGIEGGRLSYSAAVGLMKSVVSLILVLGSNRLAKTVTEYSLW